jgi:serine/threonine-protein kinase
MSTAESLLQTLTAEAGTVLKNPRSTVVPTDTRRDGRMALATLKTLTRDPRALIDEGPLGQGGMGVVHVATQVALGRKVAVKYLRENRRESADVEALLAEAWISGSLEHPNIVPVHDLGLDAQGLPVLVMKRVDGSTWSTLLRDPDAMETHAPGRPPLEGHLRILMQVCNALHFAHQHGVVHRDVKPDNVMVGSYGEVSLLDWGVATAPGPSTHLAGTPVYMAPEMLGGGAELSARTDVYLLGATLHEVLTGRPPHECTSLEQFVASVTASVVTLPAAVPAELATLVRRCMMVEPHARPASALEVRTALEDFLSHQGSLMLTRQSDARLDELETLVADQTDPRAVFTTFSECRFGFTQALREWPDNAQARDGLERSIRLMVPWELSHGSAASAQLLLSELRAPDAELTRQVAAAAERERARAADLERLKALEHDLDPNRGATARGVTLVAMGVVWVLFPLLGLVVAPWAPILTTTLAPVAVSMALIIGAGLVSRSAHSRLNRLMSRGMLFAWSFQVLVTLVLPSTLGDPGEHTLTLVSAYWFLVIGLLSVLVIKQAWPSAIAFFLATIGTYRWPQVHYQIVSAANFVVLCNALWVWRRPPQVD